MGKIVEQTLPKSGIPCESDYPTRKLMFIGYVDDSGSTGSNYDDPNSRFQVVGGPIISEDVYAGAEISAALWMEELVPAEEWNKFEFHAHEMFQARKSIYQDIGRDKCHTLLQSALNWIRQTDTPVLYGAVDKFKLADHYCGSADAQDVAFRLYLQSLDEWFDEKCNRRDIDRERYPRGMLVADASQRSNALDNSYRRLRKKVLANRPADGLALSMWDDIYFGNSKNSFGIQLADICVYFIARHLSGKADAEGFYNIIEEVIFKPRIFP